MVERGGTSPDFDFEQGSAEWLAARAGKISASRAADLMAKLKSGKPAQSRENLLWQLAIERLTGKKSETFQSAWMERGLLLEPEARQAYEDHELVSVEEVPIVFHPDYDFVSCSPDGLVGDDGLVELKCLTAANHGKALLENQHARDYYAQAQMQMWVCGRAWCDLTAFHPDYPEHLRLAICRVHREDDFIAELERECIAANEEIEEIIARLEKIAK